MSSGSDMDLTQALVMVNWSISNKTRNIRNIISNTPTLQTVMDFGLVELNYKGLI